jgi:hypothetical protein
MQVVQLLIGGGEEVADAPTVGSFGSFREISVQEQGLLLPTQAAEVLGVCKQAVHDLMTRGKLSTWRFWDKAFVSAREVEARKNAPREKGGRPKSQREMKAA